MSINENIIKTREEKIKYFTKILIDKDSYFSFADRNLWRRERFLIDFKNDNSIGYNSYFRVFMYLVQSLPEEERPYKINEHFRIYERYFERFLYIKENEYKREKLKELSYEEFKEFMDCGFISPVLSISYLKNNYKDNMIKYIEELNDYIYCMNLKELKETTERLDIYTENCNKFKQPYDRIYIIGDLKEYINKFLDILKSP